MIRDNAVPTSRVTALVRNLRLGLLGALYICAKNTWSPTYGACSHPYRQPPLARSRRSGGLQPHAQLLATPTAAFSPPLSPVPRSPLLPAPAVQPR